MADESVAWRRIIQQLGMVLPEGPSYAPWRSFIMELFRQVEVWEEQERRNYRPKSWDFCVIHSTHPEDTARADAFKRLLETSLGLFGRTLGEVDFGERTLEAAEAMVEGSTKIFVLATKYMNRIDVPKFIYQDVLMEELQQERWRAKMVPVVVQGNKKLPFGLKNIKSIVLSDDPSTAEMVSKTIPVEAQMEVRAARRRREAMHHDRLMRLRSSRLQEIREVVMGLRERFGDDYDPTSQLEQMTEALRSMTVTDVPGMDQLVNVNNCSNVNVGPSIHFTVRYDESTTPSNPSHANTPSTNNHSPSTNGHTPSSYDHFNATSDFEDSTYNDDLSSTFTASTYAASVTSL